MLTDKHLDNFQSVKQFQDTCIARVFPKSTRESLEMNWRATHAYKCWLKLSDEHIGNSYIAKQSWGGVPVFKREAKKYIKKRSTAAWHDFNVDLGWQADI